MEKIVHKLTTVGLSLLMAFAVAAAPVLMPSAQNPHSAFAATTFSDISGHWARTYIQKAASLGIVNGYNDGTFRPENNVTRAEFTKMLNTTLGNTGTAKAVFSDVSSEQWFHADICKGVAASYINGYSDGTFGPDNTITRQEAAVILSRIIPTAGAAKSTESFEDAQEIAEWAQTAMEKIVGKGYMTGADKKLTPTASLTRGQAAKIIVELSEGEHIIKNNQTIVKDEITIKDTIYSNQISVGSQVADGTSIFENSVVLGNINVMGGGSEDGHGVLLKNSRAAKLTVARSGSPVLISASGETTVINTYVDESGVLQEENGTAVSGDFAKGFVNIYMNRKSDLDLKGKIELLSFLAAKCDARIRNGSSMETVEIAQEASRCNIVIEEGASAEIINVRGENTVLEGRGAVGELNVFANGLIYQATPKKLYVDKSVEVKPVQNFDPSEALRITADPADGDSDIAVNGTLKLTFSSTVHVTGSTGRVLTNTQAASLIQVKEGDSAGPNVAFSAKVSSNGTVVTITPEEPLAYETKYYIRIGKEDLTDEYNNANELFLSGFTTEKAPAIRPVTPVQPVPSTEDTASGSTDNNTDNNTEDNSSENTGTSGTEETGTRS